MNDFPLYLRLESNYQGTTAVMAKLNRRFRRGHEIAVNRRRKKKFKMAAEQKVTVMKNQVFSNAYLRKFIC